MLFDVGNTVLEISVAFCQINLQLIAQQVFDVCAEVRWKSHLSSVRRQHAVTLSSSEDGRPPQYCGDSII